ncbi:MAG: hypothetical protein ACFFC1_13765, partial [Promethearchaeota archaeon]
NDSHPIRATITIIWEKKYAGLKKEFENKLKSNCDLSNQTDKKGELLKLTNTSEEFYDKFDIVGELKSHTAKPSYIIKEKLDVNRTSFDLFNDREHIREAVKFIKKILKKTIKDNKEHRLIFPSKTYNWTEVYSINSVNFQRSSFKSILSENSPLLFGWFLIPITKIINIYINTEKNLSSVNLDSVGLATAIQKMIMDTNKSEIWISMVSIVSLFLVVSFIKWRQNRNVIRF